jgi:hypothetical protein
LVFVGLNPRVRTGLALRLTNLKTPTGEVPASADISACRQSIGLIAARFISTTFEC